MKKVGVIIARIQPIHKGHLELIRQALNENEEVLLLVGSADKLNKRNPIPIALRLDLAKKAIVEEFGKDSERVVISALNDLTDESDNSHEWGFYLYSHIVGITNSPAFTIYYSDGFEIIMQWFPNFITRDFISFKLNARGTIHNNLSATKVREMIARNDIDGLKESVPNSVLPSPSKVRVTITAISETSLAAMSAALHS